MVSVTKIIKIIQETESVPVRQLRVSDKNLSYFAERVDKDERTCLFEVFYDIQSGQKISEVYISGKDGDNQTQ